jgi:hypothetical protein
MRSAKKRGPRLRLNLRLEKYFIFDFPALRHLPVMRCARRERAHLALFEKSFKLPPVTFRGG